MVASKLECRTEDSMAEPDLFKRGKVLHGLLQ
jgi:hypothetical protein